MNLDKKTSDSDLNVISKFQEVSLRPLMRDFNDNFAVTFNNSKGYVYRWSNTPTELNNFTQYAMLGATYIDRSEEHTSELQSRGHLVCRLLLEKKKKQSDTT